MIKRLTTIGILLASVAWAQRSDTVWQQLTNISGTPNTNFVSAPVNNIGQSGHTIYITLTGSCSPPALSGGLYFSWDNTTFKPFGDQLDSAVGTISSITLEGTGAYPFVIAKFAYQPGCSAAAFYTGIVNTPFPYVQGTLPLNTAVDLAQTGGANYVPQPVINGGVMTTDNDASATPGLVAVNTIGGSVNAINIGVGTTAKITTNATGVSDRVYVSHMELSADTAATGVTLVEGTGTTCNGNTPITLGYFTLGAGNTVSIGPFRTQTIGHSLCIGAATGTVKGMITYGMMISQVGNSGQ